MIEATPLDMSKYKSAERFTGKDAIAKLMERDAEIKKADPHEAASPQTTITLSEDGVKVTKHGSSTVLKADHEGGHGVPDDEEVERLANAAGVKFTDDLVGRTIPFFASDERVDRHGDIVRQNFDLTEFKQNPVMPFSHQWEGLPIGSVIRTQVVQRKDETYEGPALHTLNLFATKDQFEFADTVFRMVKGGFLRGSSIGFAPQTVIDIKDEAERAELGMGRWGMILDDNMLLEHSPTTMPANPGTVSILRQMKDNGGLKCHDIIAIRELERGQIEKGAGDLATWLKTDALWVSVWKMLFPESNLQLHKELDEPFVLDAATMNQADELTKTLIALGEKVDAALAGQKSISQNSEDSLLNLADLKSQMDGIEDAMGDYMAKEKGVHEDEDEDEEDDKKKKPGKKGGEDDDPDYPDSKGVHDDDDEDDDEDEDEEKSLSHAALTSLLEVTQNANDSMSKSQ